MQEENLLLISQLHPPISDYNTNQISCKSLDIVESIISARGFSYRNLNHFKVEYDLVFFELFTHMSNCYELTPPVIVVTSTFSIKIVSPSEFLNHSFLYCILN